MTMANEQIQMVMIAVTDNTEKMEKQARLLNRNVLMP